LAKASRSVGAEAAKCSTGSLLIAPPCVACCTGSHYPDFPDNRRRLDFKSRGLGDIDATLLAELGEVVGKERGLMTGVGDGDVAKAGLEQIGVDTGMRMLDRKSLCEKLFTCTLLAVLL
jgi:hypothetical protein